MLVRFLMHINVGNLHSNAGIIFFGVEQMINVAHGEPTLSPCGSATRKTILCKRLPSNFYPIFVRRRAILFRPHSAAG